MKAVAHIKCGGPAKNIFTCTHYVTPFKQAETLTLYKLVI